MHEGLTLEAQRKFEAERGWKPTYSALTYTTAEAVILRRTSGRILDWEILVGVRTTGAPDCVGRLQGKWGTQIFPKDRNDLHAMTRSIKAQFGWESFQMMGAGKIGPWLYKSTARLEGNDFVVTVVDKQAELTPFRADMFTVFAEGCELAPDGAYTRSTKDVQWITVRDLLKEQGTNEDFMYWQMPAMSLDAYVNSHASSFDFTVLGEHSFDLSPTTVGI